MACSAGRNTRILGYFDDMALERGKGRESKGQPVSARALAKAILRVWPENLRVEALYGDLNGEPARASEWGLAMSIFRMPGTSRRPGSRRQP